MGIAARKLLAGPLLQGELQVVGLLQQVHNLVSASGGKKPKSPGAEAQASPATCLCRFRVPTNPPKATRRMKGPTWGRQRAARHGGSLARWVRCRQSGPQRFCCLPRRTVSVTTCASRALRRLAGRAGLSSVARGLGAGGGVGACGGRYLGAHARCAADETAAGRRLRHVRQRAARSRAAGSDRRPNRGEPIARCRCPSTSSVQSAPPDAPGPRFLRRATILMWGMLSDQPEASATRVGPPAPVLIMMQTGSSGAIRPRYISASLRATRRRADASPPARRPPIVPAI